MTEKVKTDEQRLVEILKIFDNERKKAETQGDRFVSLNKEDLMKKLTQKTTESPFITWMTYTSGVPVGGNFRFRAGIYNPDAVGYQDPWLLTYVLFGPANFISNSDQALLSIDYRFPSYAQGVTVRAESYADVEYFIEIPQDIAPGSYLLNCFLLKLDTFDVGSYLDRATCEIKVT